YLATFVLVSQPGPILPHRWMVMVEPAFIIGLLAMLVFGGLDYIFLIIGVNALAFFVIALVCHGELARRRPAARYLTAFYMWMSTGGVIGGISAGLVAPHVFSWVAEYPILIVLAVLCRPRSLLRPSWREAFIWLALAGIALVVFLAGPVFGTTLDDTKYKVAIGVLLAVAALFWWDKLKLAAVIALAFVAVRLYDPDAGGRGYVRSFFGVYKI